MGGNVQYYLDAEAKAEYDRLRVIILDYLYRNNKEIVLVPTEATDEGHRQLEKLYNDQLYLFQDNKYYDDYRIRRKAHIERR